MTTFYVARKSGHSKCDNTKDCKQRERPVVIALKSPKRISQPGKKGCYKDGAKKQSIKNSMAQRATDKYLRKNYKAHKSAVGHRRFQVILPSAKIIPGSHQIVAEWPQHCGHVMQRGFPSKYRLWGKLPHQGSWSGARGGFPQPQKAVG